jgi:5-methylcytosine-specific restriction endonuclease McrA
MRRTYFTFLYSGIDRKDNEKGYTEENCVPCCKRCNGIKGEWLSYEEMLEVGGLLKNGFKNL